MVNLVVWIWILVILCCDLMKGIDACTPSIPNHQFTGSWPDGSFFFFLMEAWPRVDGLTGHSCQWVRLVEEFYFAPPGVSGNAFLIKSRWFEIQLGWSNVIGKKKMNHPKNSVRFQCFRPQGQCKWHNSHMYCFICHASNSTTFPLLMAIVAAIAASTRIQCESRNRVKASLGSRNVWKVRLVFLPVVNPCREMVHPYPYCLPSIRSMI